MLDNDNSLLLNTISVVLVRSLTRFAGVCRGSIASELTNSFHLIVDPEPFVGV